MEASKELNNTCTSILISIIIIVRNEENRLRKCINSLLEQKELEVCEIVFVDGNSTDNTVSIIYEYIEKYNNIKLIQCNKYGYSYQRNVGVSHAIGEYILFISGDTICEPKLILKYKNGIKKGYDVIQGTVIQKGDDMFTNLLYKFYRTRMKYSLEDISTVNLLIRKSLFYDHKFDERIVASEDKIWFLTLTKTVNYHRMNNCIVFHTVHENMKQYSKKIYKEAMGIGISLVLNLKKWRDHNFFGWLSTAIYASITLICLFIISICSFLFGHNTLFLGVRIIILISYVLYKVYKYELYKRSFREILILERYLFSAQRGMMKGILKSLFMYK